MQASPQLLHVFDAPTVSLGEPMPKPTSATRQREAVLPVHESDGAIDIGIWECEPGEFTATHDDDTEVCQILSGSATVTGEDGASTLVSAGSLLVLPVGWRGRWTVHETIRKTYVVLRAP
jgi:uncharacterized cupin superfamily protein